MADFDSRTFKDLPVGKPAGGPIKLSELAQRIRESRTAPKTTVRPRSLRPRVRATAVPEAQPPLPGPPPVFGNGTGIFAGLAARYKAAQETNKIAAWQGVRDYIMENLEPMVATKLTSFRDLMNVVLEIEKQLLKGHDDAATDPLSLYEKWWVKPDAENTGDGTPAPTAADEDEDEDEE